MTAIQSIRGMNDILPDQIPYWELLESACSRVAKAYGYREIRFPLVEATNLFKRSIGEVTDIVEKEMYTFSDRNGESLTLRPEGTAGCVRACVQHSLLYNQTQRLWYLGPMFRYERPQKGRYRQFYQFAVEAYGMPLGDIDVEILLLSARLLKELGLQHEVELQINSLGNVSSRAKYREALVAYFTAQEEQLDADSRRRLVTNPLRILDSKNPALQALIAAAPKLIDYLDDQSKQQLMHLCASLDRLQIPYRMNPQLVRGLDYYCHLVFEWVTTALGAQGTVVAGGRYDGLVEQLGGKPTPAVGFAVGLERLALLLEAKQIRAHAVDVYVVMSEEARLFGFEVAEAVRNQLPALTVELDLLGGSFKNQFKRADKRGAQYALVLGSEEMQDKQVTLKPLRGQAAQQKLSLAELFGFLSQTQVDTSCSSRKVD